MARIIDVATEWDDEADSLIVTRIEHIKRIFP